MVLLRVDPGLIIWLWITFGIILLILRFTAWGRITGALDKRSQKIAADLEAGRVAQEKASVVLAEYDATIKRGKAEAAQLIEDARAEAARLREEMLDRSWAEVREQKAKANQEIEKARESAEMGIRSQIVEMSFAIAESILKRETATPDNKVFVEEFADRLISGGHTSRGPSSTP
ncbi:MAG TPA: F0F1 ATP synthase subunit B [Spirochaetia bacterium]|nr:F0F1 ATP synthase subunit B [Spirochaetia bacterium]